MHDADLAAAALLAHSADALLLTDAENVIRFVTPSYRAVFGHDPAGATGRDGFENVDPDDRAEYRRVFQRVVSMPGYVARHQFRLVHRDGSRHWVEATITNALDDPRLGGIVLTVADISEFVDARLALSRAMRHDGLTGLPHRKEAVFALRQALIDGGPRSAVGVFYLGLDRFKSVNDSYGTPIGDRLLVAIARRLQSLSEDGGFAARAGEDEFIVIMPSADTLDAANDFSAALMRRLRQPIGAGDALHCVTASIGVVLAEQAEDASAALFDAAYAMRQAKRAGGSRCRVFDAQMKARARRDAQLRAELPAAIGAGRIQSRYEPTVDLSTGRTRSVLALGHWFHREFGELTPPEFLPLADTATTVANFRQAVIDSVFPAWLDHARAGGGGVDLALRIGPRELLDGELVPQLAAAASAHAMPLDQLVLEISEAVTALPTAPDTLRRLTALGVRVAFTGLGAAGFPPQQYLSSMLIDTLEIDPSLVHAVPKHAAARSIAEAMCTIGTTIGLHVVASGVETHEQLDALRELGCREARGPLFGPPLDTFPAAAQVVAP